MFIALQFIGFAAAFIRGWGYRALWVGAFAWSGALWVHLHPLNSALGVRFYLAAKVGTTVLLIVMAARPPKRLSAPIPRFFERYRQYLVEGAQQLHADALLLAKQGHVKEAVSSMTKAHRVFAFSQGPQSAECANCLHQLAVIHLRVGDFDKAEAYIEQAAPYSDLSGEAYGNFLSDCAKECYDQKQFGASIRLLKRALQIFRETVGDNHRSTLIALANLTRLYLDHRYKQKAMELWGSFGKAELLSDALATQKQELDTVAEKGALLLELFKANRFDEAFLVERELMDLARKHLGEASPQLLDMLLQNADIFYTFDKFLHAEVIYREALRVILAHCPNSLKHAICLNQLALILKQKGRFAEAEPLYRDAQKILRTIDPESIHYMNVLHNLASLLAETYNFQESEELHRQALDTAHRLTTDRDLWVAEQLTGLGALYLLMNRLDEARTLFVETVQLRRSALGESHPGYAGALSKCAEVSRLKGQFSRAEQEYRQAITILESLGQTTSIQYAYALQAMARTLRELDRSEEARPLFQKALELLENTFGKNSVPYAIALAEMSKTVFSMHQHLEAEEGLMQALQLCAELCPLDDFRTALIALELARVYALTDQTPKAHEMIHKVLESFRWDWRIIPPDGLVTLSKSAAACLLIGLYDDWHMLTIEVLKRLDKEGSVYAQSLHDIGNICRRLGWFSSPRSVYAFTLDTFRRVHGVIASDYTILLKEVEVIYGGLSGKGSARSLIDDAEVLFRHAPCATSEYLSLGGIVLDLAERTFESAEYADSEFYLNWIVRLLETSIPEDSQFRVQALLQDALYRSAIKIKQTRSSIWASDLERSNEVIAQGDAIEKASETVEKARVLCERFHGANPECMAAVLAMRGLLHLLQAEYEKADADLSDAEQLVPDHNGSHAEDFTAPIRATIAFAAGRYDAARSMLRPVFESDASLEPSHDAIGYSDIYARLLALSGEKDKALSMLLRLYPKRLERIIRDARLLAEEDRLRFVIREHTEWRTVLTLLLDSEKRRGKVVADAWDIVLKCRSLVADLTIGNRGAAMIALTPTAKERLSQLSGIRSVITRRILEGPMPGTPPGDPRSLDDLKRERNRLEQAVARDTACQWMETDILSVNAQAITAALPEGAILIEFVRVEPIDYTAHPSSPNPTPPPARYVAFVARPVDSYHVTLWDLGDAGAIDTNIKKFIDAISKRLSGILEAERLSAVTDGDSKDAFQQRSETQIPDAAEKLGAQLRNALIDPLISELGEPTQLFICPDSYLSLMPFEALPALGKYLLDFYHITYLNTPRDLLRWSRRPTNQSSAGLVVADPDFGLRSPEDETIEELFAHLTPEDLPKLVHTNTAIKSAQANGVWTTVDMPEFNRLPGTLREAERIAHVMQTDVWKGEAALESKLKSDCKSPIILHLATHGFFIPSADAIVPRMVLWKAAETWQLGGIARRLIGPGMNNPLLRSGVALAGAETFRRGGILPEEAEDGLLTAEDVVDLDLGGTALVVLSACDTGAGGITAGEGIFGLRRAFAIAGAATVIMSLWKVYGPAVEELMENLYTNLIRGGGRAEALREAQLELRKSYPDPFYWAAFVCVGNPLPIPNISDFRKQQAAL